MRERDDGTTNAIDAAFSITSRDAMRDES